MESEKELHNHRHNRVKQGSKKVRAGIIGCGHMAQAAHIPCLAASENAEIVGICDLSKEITAQLCRRYDIPFRTDSADELVSMDIDAVFVLTPVEWHLDNIRKALKAGKHVFTEKPAAMSCRKMVRCPEARAQLLLPVSGLQGYPIRF